MTVYICGEVVWGVTWRVLVFTATERSFELVEVDRKYLPMSSEKFEHVQCTTASQYAMSFMIFHV